MSELESIQDLATRGAKKLILFFKQFATEAKNLSKSSKNRAKSGIVLIEIVLTGDPL